MKSTKPAPSPAIIERAARRIRADSLPSDWKLCYYVHLAYDRRAIVSFRPPVDNGIRRFVEVSDYQARKEQALCR